MERLHTGFCTATTQVTCGNTISPVLQTHTSNWDAMQNRCCCHGLPEGEYAIRGRMLLKATRFNLHSPWENSVNHLLTIYYAHHYCKAILLILQICSECSMFVLSMFYLKIKHTINMKYTDMWLHIHGNDEE